MELLQKQIKNILLGLSVTGIFVSAYLTYAKLTASPLLCLDTGCDQVQNSEYSEIMGIPVAVFGAGFYFLMFIFVYKELSKYVKMWSVLGLLFSVYLTYLELFVIYAICTWCVISLVLTILLVILAFLVLPKTKPQKNEPTAQQQT